MTREEAAAEIARREAILEQEKQARRHPPPRLGTRGHRRLTTPAAEKAGVVLTPRQQTFLEALLYYPLMVQAAAAAEISVVTARQWLKREDFQAAYQQAVADQQAENSRYLRSLLPKAIVTFDRAMDSDDPMVALKAAAEVFKRNERLETGAREGPQALRITEIVVQLPQAVGDSRQPADGSRNDTGTTDDLRLPTAGPVIQGELGSGDSGSGAVVESPVEKPDSAWGSLQVVVAGEAEAG